MSFTSILFRESDVPTDRELLREAPTYFKDLNLDQIIDSITAVKQEYNLKPLFFTPLHSEDAIRYRQEVMLDLEGEALFREVKTFAKQIHDVAARMVRVTEYLTQPDSYNCNYLEKGRLLDSADTYCKAVDRLTRFLASSDLKSRGLLAFRKYISDYAGSDAFTVLQSETDAMRDELADVHYCMLIKDLTIKVRKYEGEPDHTPQIEEIFQKFRQGSVKDYRQKVLDGPYAEHVEAGVLNLVARLYPDIFSKLNGYCTKNMGFVDQTLFVFSREVQFYIAYLGYIESFKHMGLCFCYPQMSGQCKEVRSIQGYDLALAGKLVRQGLPVICNDFYLEGKERIIVISGPNQGGKTTFARVFGQLHHLASLGCPVAGSGARLFLFDRIFTHFAKEEDIQSLSGKLQDDLIRMYDIMEYATKDSIIIINEILSSTTLKDAVSIGKRIMDSVIGLDALCVCVTFLDELTSCSEKTVSMISTVVPEDPVRRTYKIVRSPADGLAYAIHIAQKYRLTYSLLKERIIP